MIAKPQTSAIGSSTAGGPIRQVFPDSSNSAVLFQKHPIAEFEAIANLSGRPFSSSFSDF
jgi:hypothetical protein